MANEAEPAEPEVPLTLELATTDQIVIELLKRSTFLGVVVRLEEIKDKPIEGRPLSLNIDYSRERLNPFQIEQMLATALDTWRECLPKKNPNQDRPPDHRHPNPDKE